MNSFAVSLGAPVGSTAVSLRQISQTQPLTLVYSVPTAPALPTADPLRLIDRSVGLHAFCQGPITEKPEKSSGKAVKASQ